MSGFGRLARMFGLGIGTALPPRDGYALWADSYPAWAHNPLMVTEQSVVAPILATLTPRRALDVGTGTGRYLPLLEAAGARLVVGLDLSLHMLGHNQKGRLRVCADARRLPFPDARFDVVCSSLMAGDVENLGVWTGEASRVLAPGGHLVYLDFHPSWHAGNWRRTFTTSNGRRVELSYFPHTIDEHLAWLEKAGLDVRTIREPRIDRRSKPVVVVFHAVKPGCVRPRC